MIIQDEARRRLDGSVRSNDKPGRRRGHCEIKTDYSSAAHFWLAQAVLLRIARNHLVYKMVVHIILNHYIKRGRLH